MRLLIFFLLVFNSSFSKEQPKTSFFHSESTSFLHFLASGFNDSFTSGSMKQLVESKKIDAFKSEKWKKQYQELYKYLYNGYNFKTVATRPAGFYGADALISLSVTNPKLRDFEKNLSILMPYDGIKTYYKLKNKFYPQFVKHIWEPTLKGQSHELRKIQKIIKETKFSSLLKKASLFYDSEYPWEVSFKVALVPIDDRGQKKRHTSAQNLRDAQVVPYAMTKGVKHNMDVIFHEFCHALYEGQSYKKKEYIENFYLSTRHSHGQFVYRYLNEALATALGNGWYREILDGKYPNGNWYAVGYIDGLAKAYFPLVKSYLNSGKKIDKKFLNETLDIAKKEFPDAPYELDSNLMAIRVISDHKEISARFVANDLRKKFRVQSMRTSSPILQRDWEKIFSQDNSSTVIVTSDKKKAMSKFEKTIELKDLENSESFLATFKIKNRYVFWINAKNKEQLLSFITKIKSIKKLSPKLKLFKL